MGAIAGEELMQEPGACEDRIFVSVRLRPLNDKEIAKRDPLDWECINDNTIIYRNTLSVSERSMYPNAYSFDKVFRSDTPTRKVYEEGAKEVALSVVSGINSTVFAYGQTSSGKTYTMSGITEYTVADIYDYIERHMERDFLLKFSAIEIYNESVRDLLSADSSPLRLLDDPERGTIVEKLTEESLSDWSHFKELLSMCEAQRQVGETSLNEASSRSHQILRLTIESSAKEYLGNDKSSSLSATVNFVDLAGSERASQSLSAGTRLKEGCHINRSLLTLGTVIRKLSKGRNGHVPFRDSKLTRILQSSLGGNARTAIICTLSPARSHVEQTRNTLLFASCAKEVTTNAKVNVVVSDKALVKHLQRELARLETELNGSGLTHLMSESAALLREKDLEVQKLKAELMEATLQRDLAQSQVKDLLKMIAEEKPIASANNDDQYPKLRVRSSWDFENHITEIPSVRDSQSLDAAGSFDESQYSDGNSSISEENAFQLDDFEGRISQTPSSTSLSVRTPAAETKAHQEMEEQSDYTTNDLCKEVRCIESEYSIADQYVPSTVSCYIPSGYANSNVSSPAESTATSKVTAAENGDSAINGFCSPSPKEEHEFKSFNQIVNFQSPEKSSNRLFENDINGYKNFKLVRSRSCQESLLTKLSPCQFQKMEKNEITRASWLGEDFAGRFEGLPRKLTEIKYATEVKKLSRSNSQISVERISVGENDEQYRSEPLIEKSNIDSSVPGIAETVDVQCGSQLVDNMVPETELKPILAKKTVKDVGLDPIEKDVESPLNNWPSEFKKIQREIIELWHACNVSLVHRTYFFLLFKGDPADSIYMEVEFRRLSFLRDTFARGNQTIEDGRSLTPSSSMRTLRRERRMLSERMQKRLSRKERESLFCKWGIALSSNQRRMQLALGVWTDTEDMNHITESANVVAKLIGCVEPDHALKEMFGLNFTPSRRTQRFNLWKQGGKTNNYEEH